MTKMMWVHKNMAPKSKNAHMCVVSKMDDDGTIWTVHGVWVPNSARIDIKDGKDTVMGKDITPGFWHKIDDAVTNSKTSWRR